MTCGKGPRQSSETQKLEEIFKNELSTLFRLYILHFELIKAYINQHIE